MREPSGVAGTPLLRRWSASSSFDAHSRVSKQVYPSGYTLDHSYSTWSGRLQQVAEWVNGGLGQVHWIANSRNLDGQIASMTLGSGIAVSKTYDGFGRVATINAGGGNIQNASYGFDALGNLSSRSDTGNGQAAESYGYDLLNRLVTQGAQTIASYDPAGNLQSRGAVLNYVYNFGANNNHQVTSAGGYSLAYDANGNVTTLIGNGADKSLTYQPFNLPSRIQAETNTTLSYLYDGAHARIKETVQIGTAISSTYYLGGFEVHTRSDGVVEERHYLSGAEGAIGIHTRRSNALHDTRYWFKDHLGSIVAISDQNGAVKQRFNYDAWGKRTTAFNADPAAEERGYTGHEHLVEAGLIHMNGRLYFDALGRMLQADPIIQNPYNGQNYNRYSYVLNNPLALIDPSGYSWLSRLDHFSNRGLVGFLYGGGDFLGARALYKYGDKWAANPNVRMVGAMIASFFSFGAASGWAGAVAMESETAYVIGASATESALAMGASGFEAGLIGQTAMTSYATTIGGLAGGAAAGFASGGIMGGNLQSALHGAFAGALSGGIGGYFGSSYLIERIAANAVAGGVSSAVQGRKFADGFRSALATSMLVYANVQMRNRMIEQSKLDPRNNGAGLSKGMIGDGFKLAGGRFDSFLPRALSLLGGRQNAPGSVFWFAYGMGGIVDMAMESYAGPHDTANSPWWYSQQGNIQEDLTPLQRTVLDWTTNYTSSLMFATPFAIAAIREQTFFSSGFATRR